MPLHVHGLACMGWHAHEIQPRALAEVHLGKQHRCMVSSGVPVLGTEKPGPEGSGGCVLEDKICGAGTITVGLDCHHQKKRDIMKRRAPASYGIANSPYVSNPACTHVLQPAPHCVCPSAAPGSAHYPSHGQTRSRLLPARPVMQLARHVCLPLATISPEWVAPAIS